MRLFEESLSGMSFFRRKFRRLGCLPRGPDVQNVVQSNKPISPSTNKPSNHVIESCLEFPPQNTCNPSIQALKQNTCNPAIPSLNQLRHGGGNAAGNWIYTYIHIWPDISVREMSVGTHAMRVTYTRPTHHQCTRACASASSQY